MSGTRSPVRFEVRPIGPADRPALERFYAGLSPESREARFHGAAPGICGTAGAFFCGPDHVHREGIVAVAIDRAGAEEIIGHACLEPAGPATEEIAIAVADAWQRHGIGRELTQTAIRWARRRGVERLVASMQTSNGAIAGLVHSLDLPVRFGPPECGVVDAVIDLGVGLPHAA